MNVAAIEIRGEDTKRSSSTGFLNEIDHNPNAVVPSLFHLPYRPDIDGLRAIAVLAVISFHAYPDRITGGFVGVDIFFVISGFLISGIVFRNLESKSFSYLDFYARRAKRIFPALLAVLFTSFALGWFALLPTEYKQFGKHLAAASTFVSNFVLWDESGYFDTASDMKPLLHLWTLAIEEQFYAVWPILLGVAYKWKRNFLATTIGIALISFSINIYAIEPFPAATFYSPLTRFWELMAGGVLAYIVSHNPEYIPKKKYWLSGIGLLLIAFGIFILTKAGYPGWWALIPTLGAVLLISAGPDTWLNRHILSNKFAVRIGLISYPLYLWHWPLLAYARIASEQHSLPIMLNGGAILISVALATLTFRYIELPIRFGKYSKIAITLLSALMVTSGILGCMTYLNDGFRSREKMMLLTEKADNLEFGTHWNGWETDTQHCKKNGQRAGCKILKSMGEPEIAVIGDSHAVHLATGLAEFFRERHENIIIEYSAACMPFFEVQMSGKTYFSCADHFNERALNSAIQSPYIKTIILSGYADLYIHDNRGVEMNNNSIAASGFSPLFLTEQGKMNASAFRISMANTLERLVGAGKKVIFLVDIPELYFDPHECISIRPLTIGQHTLRSPCTINRKAFDQRSMVYHQIVDEEELRFPSVKFIRGYLALCDRDKCYASINDNLFYISSDHLSPSGSRYLIESIKNNLSDALMQ